MILMLGIFFYHYLTQDGFPFGMEHHHSDYTASILLVLTLFHHLSLRILACLTLIRLCLI